MGEPEGSLDFQIPKRENSEKISPKPSGTCLNTLRKCTKKGSRICYVDLENITVLRKIPEREPVEIPSEESAGKEKFEKLDSYRSGESLFKTFTFEQTRDIEDPETVKCIEFWKNVMKKNLAPIKCTLLENESKSKEKKRRRSSTEKRKSEERRESKDNREMPKLTCDDGIKIWSKALKEIRNKKLDQVKMYVKERCQYCTDPFTKELTDAKEHENKKEELDAIALLNEWEPEEKINTIGDYSKPGPNNPFASKIKKMSASQTAETRVNEKSNTDLQKEQPEPAKVAKENVSEPPQEVAPPKKRYSILKTSPMYSPQRTHRDELKFTDEESKKAAGSVRGSFATTGSIRGSIVSSVEVQAPDVKCLCESYTCICPHRMAPRNSLSSFVEAARKNISYDESTENFLLSEYDEDACICERFKEQPWEKMICESEPCPAKQTKLPDVQESSSCLELHLRKLKTEAAAHAPCICGKESNTTCESKSCKNKASVGSLVEGFQDVEEKPCVCLTSEYEAPCPYEVCPANAPKEVLTTCVCGSTEPWSQAICQSWNCAKRPKPKLKRKETEEKIMFKGHPPIKEVTSSCTCRVVGAWNDVTCDHEVCEGRAKRDSILKTRGKSGSLQKTSRPQSTSKEQKRTSSAGSKGKRHSLLEGENCECTTASPWKFVKCPKNCSVKTAEEENSTPSSASRNSISLVSEALCVCNDADVEAICKSPKCKHKVLHVEYPPQCTCPEDNSNLCHSETCKMRKIDTSCKCADMASSPCGTATCEVNLSTPKTLKRSQKPLAYDTTCICKVRGLPTTREVTCDGPQCPFQKKRPQLKHLTPNKLMVPVPDQPTVISEINTKCLCDSSSNIKCLSSTCDKKKHQNGDVNAEKTCICNDKQKDLEEAQDVVCRSSKCARKSTEVDAPIQDKCVCANMDETCSEPTCPAVDDQKSKIYDTFEPKVVNNYCYICGHYGCASNLRQKQVCDQVFTEEIL